MTLIAVFNRPMVRGVERPDLPMREGKPQTFDWRKIPGSPENTRRIVAAAKVHPLEQAFAAHWSTDAHFVAYVMHDTNGPVAAQPRINKSALAWVTEQGFRVLASALVADIDNPGHAPWNAALLEQANELIERCEAFRCGGYYFTAHGLRLVHILEEGVAVGEEFELMLDAWHDELEAQGLIPDRSCRDWTRLFRLPWVRRADGARQEQLADLDRLAPRVAPVVPDGAVRAKKRRSRSVHAGVEFAASLPTEWQARALVLGEAVRATPASDNWHELFLTLAGALCQRGVAPSIIPSIAAAVSAATENDDRPKDRVDAARTTVQKFVAGEPIVGADQLLVQWPGVAEALDQVVGQIERTRRAPRLPPAAEAAQLLEQAIERAPDGVSVIAAGCGVGKTRATVAVAVRAAKRGRGKRRAAIGAKTVISEPTNAMARQVADTVRAHHGKVLRVFSPASELDADGKPVCQFADSARAVASARLSVPWEMCNGRGEDPCPHQATCPAASGRSGDEDALVIVGNHGLMSGLVKAAGTTGMRVIDEPPALLETHALVATDFAAAWQHAHCFDSKYFEALKPAIQAFASLLHTMPVDVDAQEIDSLVTTDVVESARSVDAHSGPRVRWVHMRRAREQSAFAGDLARAARATWILWHALASRARWVVRREDRARVPTLLFTGPNEDLVEALLAEGRTVILDAAPDIDVLSKTAGYDLSKRTTTVHAADGAPIQRTHLHWSNGSRRALIENGALRIDRFASGLRAALAWAREDENCKTLGVITLSPFRLALEATMRPGDPAVERAWRLQGRSLPKLEEARSELSSVLARWDGTLLVGHYGAVRGLDSFKAVDAIATIGDPWPNLGEVRNDVAYLGAGTEIADHRAEWLARVELEQAHGRLRAPHRDRPGRALHVGRLRPLGPGWDDLVEVRRLSGGRPETQASATVEELRQWIDRNARGSIRGAAKMLDCDPKTLRRYLTDSRGIPTSIAERIRGGAEMPFRDSTKGVSASPQRDESTKGVSAPPLTQGDAA